MDEKEFKKHYEHIKTLPPEEFIKELNGLPEESQSFVMKEIYGIDLEEERKAILEEEKIFAAKLKALVANGIPFEEALDIVYGKSIEST